jgi:hypothetical protein
MDLPELPEWTSTRESLLEAFEKVRDDRRYNEKDRPDFLRRSTWLYPRDGCYARADHVNRVLRESGYQELGKIFVFGHLRLNTKYEKSGWVYWWYHVAPAIRIDNQVLVFDPAVDSRGPLTFATWIARISRDTRDVKISVCDGNAYSPDGICMGSKSNHEDESMADQIEYLPLEWNKLLSLGYLPEIALGDSPPWKPVEPKN